LEVNMRVRYDEQVDILYIRLKETPYHESDEIREGFILDYDKDNNVIGIEIIDASEFIGDRIEFTFPAMLYKAKKVV